MHFVQKETSQKRIDFKEKLKSNKMEFKRLDKVKFLGGVFPVGKDNEGWIDADLPPLDTTFVWGSLRSQDTDLFIIQHNHGADLETFMHYSSFI